MSDELRLPLAYKDRLAVIPGVRTVHFGSVFGGVYQDPKQSFGSFAEQAATFFETYPEVVLSDAERLAFQQDRRGCIIGHRLAARFGWKVGEAITLKGTVYPGIGNSSCAGSSGAPVRMSWGRENCICIGPMPTNG